MFPGMRGSNPRQMEAMMRKMGITTEDVDATEVIIVTKDGRITIKDPNVSIMTVQGQRTYQITGREVTEGDVKGKKGKKKRKKVKGTKAVKEPDEPEPEEEEEVYLPFSHEDVQLVMDQTGCSESRAIKALEKSGGQPAEAILLIMSEG
jgi:nascent polypeptide-associated complex subunit alpha